MDIDLADLPDNVETLQRMVRMLATERASLTEAQAEIERLPAHRSEAATQPIWPACRTA
jgi:hypothetical protein